MPRSRPQLPTLSYPRFWLILSIIVLILVLVLALIPAKVVWATPPNQATVPTRPPRGPPIPEPATIALVGLGVSALVGYAWRRRRSDVEPPDG